MPTIDELFNEAAYDDINDVIQIDPVTRQLHIPTTELILGVEGDEKAECKYFTMPSMLGNNVDLTACSLRIYYKNANGEEDYFPVKECINRDDAVTFCWELSRKVTKYRGDVSFSVCVCHSVDDIIQVEWNTAPAIGKVLPGLNHTGDGTAEDYKYDVLAEIDRVAAEATKRAPYIGYNDNWFVFNAATNQYEDTGVCAKGGGTLPCPLPVEYMPDGVPWIEDEGVVEVPISGVWENGVYTITAPVGLNAGETYVVDWNGTEYICVAQKVVDEDGLPFVTLGDIYTASDGFFGTVSTGEPFVIMTYSFANSKGEYGVAVGMDGSTDILFFIYKNDFKVNKLDNHCLDLAWLPTYIPKYVTMYDNVVHIGTSGSKPFDAPLFDVNAIVDGETHVVTFNGTVYECIGHKIVTTAGDNPVTIALIGNTSKSTLLQDDSLIEDTGEPFLYECWVSSPTLIVALHTNVKNTDVTLKIACPVQEPNKMPVDFLPMDEIINNVLAALPTWTGGVY